MSKTAIEIHRESVDSAALLAGINSYVFKPRYLKIIRKWMQIMLDNILFVLQVAAEIAMIYHGLSNRIVDYDRKIFKNSRLWYIVGGIVLLIL